MSYACCETGPLSICFAASAHPKVMEEYKRKYSEVAERLMERNRQYQKLQGLYDSLRLRNIQHPHHQQQQHHQHHQEFNPGKGNVGDYEIMASTTV